MGNGLTPPGSDIGGVTRMDDGTLARTPSPPPGVVGLDARGGTTPPAANTTSIADRVVSFARRQRGDRVGDGQCFALAHRALRAAGAKSAADYGEVTPDADYVWGASVALSALQPGDVIQFRNYQADVEIVTETSNATTTRTEEHTRPHHTAIVESVGGNGLVTVLEQNAPEGSPVVRSRLYMSRGTVESGNTTTTVRVRGTLWFYRPEPR